jgi:lysophospholipase L1-like esterase
MVLGRILNAGADPENPPYWVNEEGLNGRTSCLEDAVEGDRNGLRQLIPILESHMPLDFVAILLGTNDLKHRFNPMPYDIARGAQRVAEAVQNSRTGANGASPRVLLICPPPTVSSPVFSNIFGDPVEISRQLAPLYQALAQEIGVLFLDAGKVVTTSSVDGIHLEAASHHKLAEAVAEIIKHNL